MQRQITIIALVLAIFSSSAIVTVQGGKHCKGDRCSDSSSSSSSDSSSCSSSDSSSCSSSDSSSCSSSDSSCSSYSGRHHRGRRHHGRRHRGSRYYRHEGRDYDCDDYYDRDCLGDEICKIVDDRCAIIRDDLNELGYKFLELNLADDIREKSHKGDKKKDKSYSRALSRKSTKSFDIDSKDREYGRVYTFEGRERGLGGRRDLFGRFGHRDHRLGGRRHYGPRYHGRRHHGRRHHRKCDDDSCSSSSSSSV